MSKLRNKMKLAILIFGALSMALVCFVPANAEAPYMVTVQRKVRRAWVKPSPAPEKKAKVRFKIELSGEVKEIKLVQSSGSKDWDQSALDAINKAGPFAPLPEKSPNSVEVEYTFDNDEPSRNPLTK